MVVANLARRATTPQLYRRDIRVSGSRVLIQRPSYFPGRPVTARRHAELRGAGGGSLVEPGGEGRRVQARATWREGVRIRRRRSRRREQRPTGLAVNTVCMFTNTCSRSLFAVPVQI